MNEHDNNEQPEASSSPKSKPNPPSDFNDLHVAVGLSEVRAQIEHGIANQVPTVVDVDVASAIPPTPSDGASQSLGSQVEKSDDLQKSHDNSTANDEFSLTYAPPMNGHSDVGEPEKHGSGEVIPFERPDFTLEKCLVRFMHVEGKTDVWDTQKKEKLKGTAFTKLVGKSVATKWQSHASRLNIDVDTVKAEIDLIEADKAKDLINRYVHLESTLESWDLINCERVKNITIREAHPNFYDIWFKSPHRKMTHVRNIVFDPTEQAEPPKINTFTGLTINPILDENDEKLLPNSELIEKCGAIIDLLKTLCGDEKHAYGWLIRWLAYPLQHRGAKMASAVLMHGSVHGAGKSLFFGEVMSKIYGKYHITLDQRDLESQYNDWAEQKLFLLFEEITNNKTKHGMTGFIKHLITGSMLSIHKKFMSAISEANHMNTVFLSNNIQPLPIEENDRRFLVVYPDNKLDGKLKERVVAEMQSQEAIEAFYTLLLQVDLKDFGTHVEPPMTKAKMDIIEYSKAGYDTFITHWRAGETIYPYITCTVMQLYDAYTAWSKKTGEHVVSLKRFMGEARKYDVRSSSDQKHWRKPSAKHQKKQTKVVVIGEMPKDVVEMDWLGESIQKFDDALHGENSDVPYPNH